MKSDIRWKTFVTCLMIGLAFSAAELSTAQSRNSATAHRTSTKAKKTIKHKKHVKKVVAKAKVPTTGVVVQGTFRPLKSDDRMTVILQGKPTTKADLALAKSRKTVFTQRTITPSNQTIQSVNANNYSTTAMIVNTPDSQWWGNRGPTSVSHYEPQYGMITVVNYSWGNVMYTYGYQVVNYWNGNGYDWVAYRGNSGVAYPVLFR